MREVLLAQDEVLVSFVEALLTDAGVGFAVLDRNMHALQITPGAPQRVMVAEEQWQRARQILHDAGLGPYLARAEP